MMGRPQQPELARSENTDLQPDHAETRIEAHGHRAPDREDADEGPIPEENRPGHRPDEEQDKPRAAMAARLGVLPDHRGWRVVIRAASLPFRWGATVLDAVARGLERLGPESDRERTREQS